MVKFTSLGFGNMGSAITNGAVDKAVFKASDIGIYEQSQEKIDEAKARGYRVFSSIQEDYENSEILMLAIKPQNCDDILRELAKLKAPSNQIVLSIMAGKRMEHIRELLGADKKVVRVMPNTPLLIGQGASVLAKTENVTADEFNGIMEIFKSIGYATEIEESLIDAVTPANGSTPAFVYYFIRAFANSCEGMGLDRKMAIELLCKTFIGSANMVLQSEDSLDVLIDRVCSPKGATLEAIKVFDELGLNEIIDKASVACVKRATELGK